MRDGTRSSAGALGHPSAAHPSELLDMPDVVETHVPLWCARPTVGMMVQVKP
jgi:hypothetical protein